jgi:hypothetical protein
VQCTNADAKRRRETQHVTMPSGDN